VVALHVGLIEKLRCDHQRTAAHPGMLGGVDAALQVGLRIAQAAMHDDQCARDLGQRLAPILAQAQAEVAGLQMKAIGADHLDAVFGREGATGHEHTQQ